MLLPSTATCSSMLRLCRTAHTANAYGVHSCVRGRVLEELWLFIHLHTILLKNILAHWWWIYSIFCHPFLPVTMQCARGNAIIAELSRLAEYIPPIYRTNHSNVSWIWIRPCPPLFPLFFFFFFFPFSFLFSLKLIIYFQLWRPFHFRPWCVREPALHPFGTVLLRHLGIWTGYMEWMKIKTKYQDIILDFSYFKSSEYYDNKINSSMVRALFPQRILLQPIYLIPLRHFCFVLPSA